MDGEPAEAQADKPEEAENKPKKQKREKEMVFKCLNKKCKSGKNFKTEPISRIVRNILSTFEFEQDGDTLVYEKMIK